MRLFAAALLIVASPFGCVCASSDVVVTLRNERTDIFAAHGDAFTMQGAGSFDFDGDTLIVRDGPGCVVLVLDAAHTNYRATVDASVNEGGNSGVFVRAGEGTFYPTGVEVQIDPADPKNPTGSIYDVDTSDAPVPPANQSFVLEIVANGDRVESFVDGVFAARVENAPPSGPIFALQAHHPGSVATFTGLSIEPLP